MTDLISRQAAIDAIRKSASKFSGFMEMEMYTDDDAVEAINGVPSAEPVRHGKWIEGKCNHCGEHAPYWSMATTYYRSNYCPHCGFRMDEE